MNFKKIKREVAHELFPALAYDADTHIYFLDGNALGFGFFCQPMAFGDDKVADRLNVLLNLDWPTNSIMQVVNLGSLDIEKTLEEYTSLSIPGNQGILGQIRPERAKFLRSKTKEALDSHSGTMVRDLQLVITGRIPLKNVESLSEKELETAARMQKSVQQTLAAAGLHGKILSPGKYVRMMSAIFNREGHASWIGNSKEPWDENSYIREQILDYDTSIGVDPNGVTIGDNRVKLLSVKRSPDQSYFGLARRFLSEPLTGSRGIRENTIITASVLFPDATQTTNQVERERQWVTNQAYGPMLKFSPRLGEQKESFDVLCDALNKGDRPVKVYLGVVLITDKENQESAVSNARTYWREVGFQLLEDRYITMPLFLTNLPFGACPEDAKELMRYRKMATRHALNILPFFGSWKGTGTPMFQLVARDGQLMNMNLYDSNSNFNSVISAKSGVGKSVFVNLIIDSYLSAGGRVWVLDAGHSYEKLCSDRGGQYLDFRSTDDVCINLFQSVKDWKEESDMLVDMIMAMAAPNQGLNDFQISTLRKIMAELWEEHGNQSSIDLLAEKLLEWPDDDRSRVKDIGAQLYAFTSAGEYGRFFNGNNNVKFNDRLAVVELQALKGRRHLQQVILLLFIYQVMQDMYEGKRDRPKILVIDEAWDLLAQGNIARFIETGYRVFRKYGGLVCVVTQSLNDLYQSPSGQAIAENSANKFLLAQEKETIVALEKQGRFEIGEFGYNLLKTVHTIPGEYSEIFCMTERGMGIGRNYLDDFAKLLYSTKHDEVEAIRQLEKQGLDTRGAIVKLLENKRRAA